MLSRSGRIIQFECEGCSDVLDTEVEDFADARERLREEGWVARNESGQWNHYCRSCKNG